MKTRVILALALSFLILVPAAVRADAQQDQDACMIDAQVVCGQFIPDRERVAQCLMSNKSKISPACRNALRHWK